MGGHAYLPKAYAGNSVSGHIAHILLVQTGVISAMPGIGVQAGRQLMAEGDKHPIGSGQVSASYEKKVATHSCISDLPPIGIDRFPHVAGCL